MAGEIVADEFLSGSNGSFADEIADWRCGGREGAGWEVDVFVESGLGLDRVGLWSSLGMC